MESARWSGGAGGGRHFFISWSHVATGKWIRELISRAARASRSDERRRVSLPPSLSLSLSPSLSCSATFKLNSEQEGEKWQRYSHLIYRLAASFIRIGRVSREPHREDEWRGSISHGCWDARAVPITIIFIVRRLAVPAAASRARSFVRSFPLPLALPRGYYRDFALTRLLITGAAQRY